MFINKIGSRHLEAGTNCQDFGFIKNNRKVVVDGCSESLYSDIGVNLFCRFLQEGKTVEESFDKLNELFQDVWSKKQYLCFTIFIVIENDSDFTVMFCGDGYIIQHLIEDDSIHFEKITNGDYPEYFIYNYISPDHLSLYKNGVSFKTKIYPKDKYKNIGISSDGLEYIFNTDFEEDFINLLKEEKENSLKRLINKNNGNVFINMFDLMTSKEIANSNLSKTLKDDLTIAF